MHTIFLSSSVLFICSSGAGVEGIKDPSNVSPLGLHQLCQPSSFVIKPHTLQLSNNLLD